jgi:GTP-binding protein
MDKLSKRKGSVQSMTTANGQTRLIFEIPTRGLLGYRGEFTVDTRGEGILSARVIGFRSHAGEIIKTEFGSMVSMATGKSTAFALDNLQTRGNLYIGPSVELYEGMVVGNVAKGNDMHVNPVKGKQLTNMRKANSEEGIRLTTPIDLTLERALEMIAADEYLEITPQSVRLRKKYLTEAARKSAGK